MSSRSSDAPPLNILIAWPYYKADLAEVRKGLDFETRLYIDSGAFTAWKAGEKLDVDAYCDFIESLHPKPTRYFTLDVIGDKDGTRKNYERMLERGLSPIPIFTRGEDVSELDQYYETSDLVALGGLVGTKGNRGFVKGIMRHVGDRKTHWLGFGSLPFIGKFIPYSVDSSSWSSGVRYGSVTIYKGGGEFVRVSKKDFINRPPDDICKAIDSLGVDLRRMTKAIEWTNSGRGDRAIEVLALRSWVKYAGDMERNTGTHFYLAVSCKRQFKLAADAWRFWNRRTA